MNQPGEKASPDRKISEEISELAAAFEEKVANDEFAQETTRKISDQLNAAAQSQNYAAVREVVEQYKAYFSHSQAGLEVMLTSLANLELIRTRRERYTPAWWERVQRDLEISFQENPEKAYFQWVELYTQALLDWRLDACLSLAKDSFSPSQVSALPGYLSPYFYLIRYSTDGLKAEDYQNLFDLLNYLTGDALAGKMGSTYSLSRALLHIFAGRIHLYKKSDPQAALGQFKNASELAPLDGRPLAALGHYYRSLGADQLNEAIAFFSRSIELSPSLPDGLVGKGLLAEDQAAWSEADDWYRQAIQTQADEPDVITALTKLLAPASGNLFLRLGRSLHQDGKLQQAQIAVDRALELDIKDGTDYPDRLALSLKGKILEQLSLNNDAADLVQMAAQAYFQAGRDYYWLNDFSAASDLLHSAIRLDPKDVFQYWYLADVLRILSYKESPPNVYPEVIREALQVWERSALIKNPEDSEVSWAYLARASIEDQLALVPEEDSTRHYWEALVYIERAMLFTESADRWSRLSSDYRALSLYRNALATAQRALDEDKDNLDVIISNAGILIDSGELEQAEPVIQAVIQKSTDNLIPYYKGWQAMVQYFLEDYDHALESIQIRVNRYPDETWGRSLRGYIYRQLGRLDDAQADNEWIWERRDDPNYSSDITTLALTAYNLGYLDEAEQFGLESRGKRENVEMGYYVTGMCALCRGIWDRAKEDLLDAIHWSPNKRVIQDIKLDVLAVELRAKREKWSNLAEITDFLRGKDAFLNRLEKEKQDLEEQDTSPTGELLKVLDNEANCQADSWCWMAVQAGLGRLYLEAKNWSAAAEIYTALSDYPSQFAEAPKGLLGAVTGMTLDGKAQLCAGQFSAANLTFQAAVGFSESMGNWKESGDQHALMAFAQISAGLQMGWLEEISVSIQRYLQANVSPVERLAENFSEGTSNPAHFWQIDGILRSSVERPEVEKNLADMITAARLAYRENYFSNLFNLKDQVDVVPMVTQLAVELGADLTPTVPDDQWKVTQTYVKEMRSRLVNECGVRPPIVRYRSGSADLPADSYIIILREVPQVMGTIKSGWYFCPAPPEALDHLGIPDNDVERITNPIKGCWVEPRYASQILAQGLELWQDPQLFHVHHLEKLLKEHLSELFMYQDLADLLEDQPKDGPTRELVSQVLPDTTARLRFCRLLRGLLAERVSIAHMQEILATVKEAGFSGDDIHLTLRAVRQRLKPYLPGNAPGAKRVEMPESLETSLSRWIMAKDDRYYLVIPPVETEELLSKLRKLLEEADDRTVLLTRDGNLRPFLRRLLELEFPDVAVIATDELL